MKRKVLSTLLAATMLTGLLAGCGNSQEPAASNNEPTATTPAADTPAPAQTTPAADNTETQAAVDTSADEGKVLNVYCWNDEFYRRIKDHYPNYEVKIGRAHV